MPTKFAVPLVGPSNARFSAVNASDSSSGYVGVGIVGLMVVGKTTQPTDKDARSINVFAQIIRDAISGRNEVNAVKRPGFATGFTPAPGEKGYAVLVWTGSSTGTDVITAFGETNSTIFKNGTSVGAITGRCTGITETVVGSSVATILVTSTDNTAWYYDTGVGVMTKITSGNFPGNAGFTLAGTFSHIDGFACIATTDGKLWASDINSVTAWIANSFDSSNAYPDGGVATMRQGDFILNFGTESIQKWKNAGLTPFPLARVNAIKVGAVSADAIGEISDTKFFVGSTPQGGMQVFQFDGSLSPISTPEVAAILILAGASNISLTTIRNFGLSFVLVMAGATTKAYCVEHKFWFDYASTTPLWYKVAGISQGGTMVNYAVTKFSTSGKVYVQNHATLVFEDDGTTYTARIQTAQEDYGTDFRKFYSSLEIVGDIEGSSSPLTVSVSDDDYETYTVVGTVDMADQVKRLRRLGAAVRRAWVFTHSANTPLRIRRAGGLMEIGNA